MEYLDGKLTTQGFLRRINTTHELESYEADKAELVEEAAWQRMERGRRSEGRIDFGMSPSLFTVAKVLCMIHRHFEVR